MKGKKKRRRGRKIKEKNKNICNSEVCYVSKTVNSVGANTSTASWFPVLLAASGSCLDGSLMGIYADCNSEKRQSPTEGRRLLIPEMLRYQDGLYLLWAKSTQSQCLLSTCLVEKENI